MADIQDDPLELHIIPGSVSFFTHFLLVLHCCGFLRMDLPPPLFIWTITKVLTTSTTKNIDMSRLITITPLKV